MTTATPPELRAWVIAPAGEALATVPAVVPAAGALCPGC